MNEATNPSTGRALRAKRVSQACDYCRRKRLKCTTSQNPCLNCQLYSVECTTRGRTRNAAIQDHGTVASFALEQDSGHASMSVESHPSTILPESSADAQLRAFDIALSATHWTGSPGYQELASQDFDHVAQELEPSGSAAFGGLDSIMVADFSSNHAGVMNSTVEDNEPMPSSYDALGNFSCPTTTESTANSTNCNASNTDLPTKQGLPNSGQSARSIPPGMFLKQEEGVANYIGLTSVGATMAHCFKDAFQNQGLSRYASFEKFLIEASHMDRVGQVLLPDLSSLPHQEVAIQCVDAYFENINVFYPIIDEDSCRGLCQAFYSPGRFDLGVLDYSLFSLVLSLGATAIGHTSGRSDTVDQISGHSYGKAWTLINQALTTPCVASLQILLLHIIRYCYLGRNGIAWVFCGLAVRIAESIGLHRKVPEHLTLSHKQVWLRARLWWTVLHLDVSLSVSQGRPPGHKHEIHDIDEKIPDGQDRELVFPKLSQLYSWMFRLNQIQARFCHSMHTSDTIASRLQTITRTDQELSSWKDDLPMSCRPDNHLLVSPERYLEVALLHLEYFNFLRAVYWAAIATKPIYNDGWDSQQLGSRAQASEALCVEAARSYIKTLNNCMSDLKSKRIMIISFQTNNYMAAIAVLYRSISKNPSSFVARADLEHLRACKMHLDLDSPAQGTVSALRSLFDGMILEIEDIVWKPGSS